MVEVSANAYNADGLPIMSVADNLNLEAAATPIDAGTVAVSSTTTGSGFLMYSAQNVQTRFGASGGSGSLIAVACVGGQWQYDNGSGLAPFSPLPTDVLVATVDFDTFASPTSLFGTETRFYGIAEGYGAGTTADSLAFSGAAAQQTFTVTSASGSFVQNFADRVTQYGCDWRDQQTYVVNPPDAGGNITYSMTTYDNADEATDSQKYLYQGNAADLPADLATAAAAATPATLDGSDVLLAWTHSAFDNLGQVYQTTAYGVYPTNCGALVTNTWHDADGNTIETQTGGVTQGFTKTAYDGLDRPTVAYVGFDPTGSPATCAAAGSVAGDIILQQTDTQYDPAGDATLLTTYERYDDASTSDTGALDVLQETTNDTRVSYVAYWLDGTGRETAEQNFGATATAPTPSAAQPGTDSSGATQVSLTDYNARGEAGETVDPAGNITLTTCDDEGRTIETIQNYSATISAATNIVTDYAFNAGSALLSATSVTTENADLSGTQTQITAYVYGTATDDPSPAIYRDDLVCAVVSGVSTSQLPNLVYDVSIGYTSSLNLVEYKYDRQGEVIQMIDQNGTQHDYTLDNLGRQVSDTATVLGAGVYAGADAVRRIDTAYDVAGHSVRGA
jgi:YD repeat-containing protein